MKKETVIRPAIITIIMALLVIASTYSIYRGVIGGNGAVSLAAWNVSLNQTGISNTLTIIPGTGSDTYDLNITSTSKVDIKYTIVVSNLPTGVKVALGSGNPQQQDNEHKVTFADAGTILYSASQKTNTHTLTFSAVANTTPVNTQSVSIDVIAEQILD